MRKKLLLSTAALLAGVAIASAQDMPGGKSGSAAQSGAQMERGQMERGSSGASHEQGRAGQAQRGAQDQSKKGQPREQTTGQAKQGKQDQSQMQGQRELGKQGQAQQRHEGKGKRDQTTGQSQRGQDQSKQAQQPKQGQAKQGQQDHTTGQGPQRQQSQQAPQQNQGQQGQTSGQTGSSATGQAGSVNLTAQQRTHIQQTVLAGRNVPRVDNINFSLSVGTVVPSHVRVVEVVPALIEINPAWRGHEYFVVRDEIIIVDHSRKVVAVLRVGSSGAQLHNRGGASSASAALDLRPEQIREIQMVLKERGFAVEVDGRLGSRTRQALIAFQRKQGLTASGRIDNQTVSALGVSDKIGAQGGATTGQGYGAANQGKAAQQPAQQNQGTKQPSASGQGSASPQQKPTQQNKAQPSTSGQGGATKNQAPAMKNEAPAQKNQGASKPSTSGESSGKAEQSGSSK